jgi:hypothetical protein
MPLPIAINSSGVQMQRRTSSTTMLAKAASSFS